MSTPAVMPPFAGATYEHELDHERLGDQMLRVYQAMLDGQWRTLAEVSEAADAPQASVSARLRDLRKSEFGGNTVNRRRRGLPSAGCWEYQLQPPGAAPDDTKPSAAKRSGYLKGLMVAARIVAGAESLTHARLALRRELLKAAGRTE